jgi:sugar phosphate isomerase/epimerase
MENPMNIVTTTSVFPPEYPAASILNRLAALGFTHLDMAFDYCTHPDSPFMGEGWREWAESLRRKADGMGVRYTHSHACGGASSRSPAMLRCFEACQLLGIRYLVVHPDCSADGRELTHPDEFIRHNAEAYRGLIPYAEKHNVIILSENILWNASIYPTVIADLVKTVDSPFFGWCCDTGHIHCSGVPMTDLRKVSVPPLSLHVQDNDGSGDQHSLPGDGTIDWKEFLDILREIDYKGELVLEAHHQSLEASDDERDAILSELLRRSERMREYMDRL